MKDVCTHLERFGSYFLRISMHGLIFPAIAQVGFIRIEQQKSSLMNNAKALRWFSIMLMDFGQAFRKRKCLVVDWMVKWQFS